MDDRFLQMSSECGPTVGHDQYLVRPRGVFSDGHTGRPSTVIYVDSHRGDNDKRVAFQTTSVCNHGCIGDERHVCEVPTRLSGAPMCGGTMQWRTSIAYIKAEILS